MLRKILSVTNDPATINVIFLANLPIVSVYCGSHVGFHGTIDHVRMLFDDMTFVSLDGADIIQPNMIPLPHYYREK